MYHSEVVLVGRVIESTLYLEDGFYKAMIEVTRMSGIIDRVPLDIPGWIMPSEKITGKKMKVIGRLWSPTKLSVLVDVIFQEDCQDKNEVYLRGEVYRKGKYREVCDQKKQLVDIVVRTKYEENRNANVPCLAWNRMACWVSELEFGEAVEVIGRIQSRKYAKVYENGTEEEIETFEVSAKHIRSL